MAEPKRPDDPMRLAGARWCEQHNRWECSKPRSKGRGVCHQAAISGTAACRMHSGKSGVRAKAEGEMRLLELQAGAWAPGIGDIPNIISADIALKLLHQSWCRLHVYGEQLRVLHEAEATGALVGPTWAAGRAGERVETGEQVRALARLEADERDRCARFAKLCHDMRIDERQIELAQGQAELVVAAALAGLEALGLVPGDRDVFLRAFLGRLGRGESALEVAPGRSDS